MNGMWKTRYVLLAPIFVTVLICAQGNLNVTVDSLSVGTTKTYCINSTIEYLIEILNLTHVSYNYPNDPNVLFEYWTFLITWRFDLLTEN